MDPISYIKKDHLKLRAILKKLGNIIEREDNSTYPILNKEFNELEEFWKIHEKREENLFKIFKKVGKPFPTEKMLLKEHRQLKGHWKILKKSLTRNENEIRVALDTDGRMLLDKFYDHINKEDYFLEKMSWPVLIKNSLSN